MGLNTASTFTGRVLALVLILVVTPLFNTFALGADAQTPASRSTPIRIGITPVILDQQFQFLREWKSYLESQLERPVEFVQRDSYGKITTHLLKGELDFGWICGYPYVQHQSILELIAIPLFYGKPLYHSYLIVADTDTQTRSLLELQDTVFAYSDPDSNSGYLYAQYILIKAGKNPKKFFKQSFFTWQHRNTVEAVATGLAQAGAVDSYIWDTMKKQGNPLIARTRVAHKSRTFSFPPLVSTKSVSSELKKVFQETLLSMEDNPRGKLLLKQLNIDGFISGNSQSYKEILEMHLFIEKEKHGEKHGV